MAGTEADRTAFLQCACALGHWGEGGRFCCRERTARLNRVWDKVRTVRWCL